VISIVLKVSNIGEFNFLGVLELTGPPRTVSFSPIFNGVI